MLCAFSHFTLRSLRGALPIVVHRGVTRISLSDPVTEATPDVILQNLLTPGTPDRPKPKIQTTTIRSSFVPVLRGINGVGLLKVQNTTGARIFVSNDGVVTIEGSSDEVVARASKLLDQSLVRLSFLQQSLVLDDGIFQAISRKYGNGKDFLGMVFGSKEARTNGIIHTLEPLPRGGTKVTVYGDTIAAINATTGLIQQRVQLLKQNVKSFIIPDLVPLLEFLDLQFNVAGLEQLGKLTTTTCVFKACHNLKGTPVRIILVYSTSSSAIQNALNRLGDTLSACMMSRVELSLPSAYAKNVFGEAGGSTESTRIKSPRGTLVLLESVHSSELPANETRLVNLYGPEKYTVERVARDLKARIERVVSFHDTTGKAFKEITIPSEYRASFFGSNGMALLDIRAETGTIIDTAVLASQEHNTDRVLRVYGMSDSQIDRALDLIGRRLSLLGANSRLLKVPTFLIPFLIGPKGRNIECIKAHTNTTIEVDYSTAEGPVSSKTTSGIMVTGDNKAKVNEAYASLLSQVSHLKETATVIQVPNNYMGLLVGKGGVFFEKVKKDTGAIILKHDSEPNSEPCTKAESQVCTNLLIMGMRKDDAQTAFNAISDRLEKLRKEVIPLRISVLLVNAFIKKRGPISHRASLLDDISRVSNTRISHLYDGRLANPKRYDSNRHTTTVNYLMVHANSNAAQALSLISAKLEKFRENMQSLLISEKVYLEIQETKFSRLDEIENATNTVVVLDRAMSRSQLACRKLIVLGENSERVQKAMSLLRHYYN
ncbi:hypothetical protein BABINDRAFT_159884 [Babjeviella inositovora NRRL Y-12698]|uniref:K Homology domain-containing protein n=1 Tax=Babjeviella inositovora NRRL Y-12698 TaxID=984486 RepID=A0A1E3QVC7_9ASCO|nr:uncharacterized protein BABINDRAFT_159884 [Babjeviella inositovora NRRL Y-12698]ODQ81615.1 hypothetical protein BABINDRAFT_159884 [Babjeviella inositovora NRRL Y-12698]